MTSFCFLFLPFFGLHLLSLVDICSGSIVQNDTTTLLLATTGKRVTYVDDSLRRLGEQEGENLNSAEQEDMETTVVASRIFTGGMESVERRRLGKQKVVYFERTSGLCTDVAGGSLIVTKEDCGEGASVLGWLDTTAHTESAGHIPPGCFDWNGYLKFNTDTSSTKQCSSSKKCLCKLTCPAGTYQDQTGQTTCKPCGTNQFSPARF